MHSSTNSIINFTPVIKDTSLENFEFKFYNCFIITRNNWFDHFDQDFCDEIGSLNVGMMLKTEQIFSKGFKRNCASRQKIPILMRQKKDKVNRMETQFSTSHPPASPRSRPFFRNDFPSEQILSASNNVSIIKRFDCLSCISQKFCSSKLQEKKHYKKLKKMDFSTEINLSKRI